MVGVVLTHVPLGLVDSPDWSSEGAEFPWGSCPCSGAHVHRDLILHDSWWFTKLSKCLIFNFPEELTFKETSGEPHVVKSSAHNV